MIKLGVIGLGDIAQKAYLPVYSQLQDQFEWHLISRDSQKLTRIQKQYGFQHGSTNQDDLLKAGVDAVFIHTPTPTHYAIIKKFLEQRINVYVDKPVSENLDEVEELYQLADQNKVMLTCGFNRRFAPVHQNLLEIPDKHTVTALKSRVNEHQTPSFAIFDLMIHVIDLVQFLMGTNQVQFKDGQIIERDGELVLAQVNLMSDHILGIASVDMQAGVNDESIQVVSNQGITTVENLRILTTKMNGDKLVKQVPDWQPTLEMRGFAPLIKAFLKAIVEDGTNPVSPTSAICAHALCVRLISEGKVIK